MMDDQTAHQVIMLTLIALAGTGLPLGLWLVKRWGQRLKDRAHKTYEMTYPLDRGLDDYTRAVTILSGVYGPIRPGAEPFGRNTIVFEVLSTPERLHYLLSFPPSLTKTVEALLTGVMRDIGMEESTIRLKDYKWRYVVELKRDSFMEDPHAARSEDRYKQRPIDPKAVEALLESTRQLNQGEAVLIQFVTTPTGRLRDDKHPEFYALGRLAVAADYQDKKLRRIRSRQLMSPVLAAYRSLHVFTPGLPPERLNRYVNERHAPVPLDARSGSYIPEELAVMLALPIGSPQVPGLVMGKRRLVPDPAISSNDKDIVLGEANFPGRQRLLAVSRRALTMNLHGLGPQGSGKTTLAIRGSSS
jgi:hypothetical protein